MPKSREALLPAGWDFSADVWPVRSVLYGVTPEGAGTGMVTSLASHVMGLAWTHGVPPIELLHWIAEAAGRPGVPGRQREDFEASYRDLLRRPRTTLLAPSRVAAITVEALDRLKGRRDTRTTTLLDWGPVLPTKHAFRPLRTYCACCLEEWSREPHPTDRTPSTERPSALYEPLLWQLAAVEVCPRHGVRLRTACPNPDCGRRGATLETWARPGYCGRCGAFLGRSLEEVLAEEAPLDANMLDWQASVTECLSDLIAHPPPSGDTISPLATPRAVRLAVERATGGSYARFAEQIRMSLGTVSLWKDGRRRPTLVAALRICAVAGFRLPDFLAGRLTQLAAAPMPSRTPYIPPSEETHEEKDWARVAARLEELCRQEPPPSLGSVRRGLRVDARQLSRLFPDHCERIRARHLEWVEDCHLAAQYERQELVLAAIHEVDERGVYPSRRQVQRLLPSAVSLRAGILERLWKDEVQRLGFPRPDKPVRRAGGE